jgi:hypothetical protein
MRLLALSPPLGRGRTVGGPCLLTGACRAGGGTRGCATVWASGQRRPRCHGGRREPEAGQGTVTGPFQADVAGGQQRFQPRQGDGGPSAWSSPPSAEVARCGISRARAAGHASRLRYAQAAAPVCSVARIAAARAAHGVAFVAQSSAAAEPRPSSSLFQFNAAPESCADAVTSFLSRVFRPP